jgi:hypothetical protein
LWSNKKEPKRGYAFDPCAAIAAITVFLAVQEPELSILACFFYIQSLSRLRGTISFDGFIETVNLSQ